MTATTASSTKHPKGLYVLFATEMWERFNFYGMRALLTLYLVNSLLMKEADVSIIYGSFLGLCYLTPMLGGFIADRFLGNRNCILIGGTLMAIGQVLLFTSASIFGSDVQFATNLMWFALGVLIFGNGFFKPNISSMVGSLYPKQEKSKLDTAFTIFYMGINLGALLGQFFCPLLGDVKNDGIRDIHAFRWGFLAAGCAMMIGTVTFMILKNKYIRTPEGRPIGELPSKNSAADFEEGEAQKPHFTPAFLGISVALLGALFCVFHFLFGQNHIFSFIYSAGLTLAFLILTDRSLTKVETQRILVIYIVSFFIIFFWAAFEQAGSSLTFIADNQTDRNFLGWEIPPSMVQIFNGIFVVALAVPFSMLWDRLRAKDREPISPMKQAFGLALIALSYFIIAHNVKDLGISGLLAVKWLILLYLIQTCGELCLSPIGLSLVGKLAPRRFQSLLYGVFFLSNASGYALAGTLGSILPPTTDKYIEAEHQGIDLSAILDQTKEATGQELFILAQYNIASVNGEKAKASGVDVHDLIEKNNKTIKEIKKANEKAVVTAAQLEMPSAETLAKIQSGRIISIEYPKFAGFTIHDLYEFFMVFVVLCGIASAVLFSITPILKRMMHGVR